MSTPIDTSAASVAPARKTLEGRALNRLLLVLLIATACLLALRMCHIDADFPTYHFYSQDGARYTDEGFYTSAAIHHYTLGRDYIPGGWNPGVFMPVWPFLVGLVFHFTGVSAAGARSLAIVCTWIGVLLAWAVARQYRSRTFAAWSAFLAAANALGFFFGRLALLEPAFVMFFLLTVYLAGRVRSGKYGLAILVGITFIATTLTKTTGIFLLPAALYPIWANNRTHRLARWKLTGVALGTAIVLLVCIRVFWFSRFPADAAVVLGINPGWEIAHSLPRLARFFVRGTWIDPILFPIAIVCFGAAISRLRRLWRDTLFVTAFLWESGYAAFIVFHYDGPPRYFVVLIVPTVWLALIFVEGLWNRRRRIAIAMAAAMTVSVAWNLAFIGNYIAHPTYTLVDASRAIRQQIAAEHDSHPETSQLLIGRGAEQVALLSGGQPAIDSDGAMLLANKLDVYRPGWFMDWTDFPPERRMTVAEHRRLVPAGFYSNLNPFNGAGIVLYRLLPKN